MATMDYSLASPFNAREDAALSATYSPLTVGGKAAVRKDDLFINVKDYGAVGDGMADDTVAIQAAITAGKAVYWGTSTYRITETLTINPATTAVQWVSNGATIFFDPTANKQRVGYFVMAGKNVSINGGLNIDANGKAYSGLVFSNAGALANFTITNLEIRNCYRAAQVFSGSESLNIRGAFNKVHLENISITNHHMAAGSGTAGVEGVTGIFIAASDTGASGLYPRSVNIINPTINGIYSDDVAYKADQDGIKFFAPNDDSAVLYPWETSLTVNGGSFKNCRGRAIKSQAEMTHVTGVKIMRTESFISTNPDIDFQVGGGSVTDVEVMYNEGRPLSVVGYTGKVLVGKLVNFGSLNGLKVLMTGAAILDEIVSFSPRSETDNLLIARGIQVVGTQPNYIINVAGVVNGKHHLSASDVFAAPVIAMVGAKLGTTPGWVGSFVFSHCVNRGASVPIVKRATSTANPVTVMASTVIGYSAQV